MYLRQVAALGAQLLPDVRRGVEADDVDALIAEVEHILRHIVEHDGVGVVEVPLVGVERGHDDLVRLRTPAEVAGRGGREHLRDGLFKLVGDVPVVVEEIAVLILLLPRAGALRPLVVLAGVVHDEVEADGDAALVAVLRQRREVGHRAQLRLDGAEVRHGVAAVAAALRALQQRHEVQVVHAAVGDVIQLFAHALQVPREGGDIHQHAHQLMALVPPRVGETRAVQLAQRRGTLGIHALQHADKVVVCLLVTVVKLHIKPLELVRVPRQALLKFFHPAVFLHRFLSPC